MGRRILFFISIVIIILVFAIISLRLFGLSLTEGITLVLSLSAFIFSILSSFKNELFPFSLSIFTNGLYLVATETTTANQLAIQILLPITFINQGYREGIIELIKLIVINERDKSQGEFLSGPEINLQAFIQQNKGLNTSNMEGVFTGFLLEERQVVRKTIVFVQRITAKSPFPLRPDDYSFEIHIKTRGEKKFRKYFTIKQNIHKNAIGLLAAGKVKTLYISPDNKE